MTTATAAPAPTEYAADYHKYVSLVPAGDIIETLEKQKDETVQLLRQLTSEQAELRYAPDKWSVKELVGHLIDSERIFSYRALRFARGDGTPLTGFEQDPYVRNGHFDQRSLEDLVDEFEQVRRSNVLMLRSLDQEAWARRGIANENEVSVRALAYIIAGHELHHLGILRSRYLGM